MKYLFSILASIVFILSGYRMADAEGMPVVVKQLASGNDSLKAIALKQLIASGNPEVYPLLAAINDKKLYLHQDRLVTTGQKIAEENGSEKFAIHQVYPESKMVTDPQGDQVFLPVAALEEVDFSRSMRLMIIPLVPYLNLVSADAEKRKLGYSQLQGTNDRSVLPKLYFAISQEKNPEVLRLGKETIHSIQLNISNDPKQKKLIIDSLVNNWGPNTESILENYSAEESNAEIKAYATKAAKELAGKHDNLRIAQNIFSGISLGSILIMIALGLSIIYGLAGVINMAHGEFLMIGAYTTFCIQSIFSKNSEMFFWFSLPLSFVVAGCIGYVIERLIIRHLYSRPLESLLATWGVSLVLIQLARTLFGDLTAVRTPSILSGGWEIVPHLVLPFNRLFIISLSICMILLTYLVLYRSRLGLQIRAVTQNRKMSSCLGIETNRVDAMTFFLGSGLAGVAGCAMTLIGNVVPDMGQTYIVDSFLVVVTGGVGNIAGSIFSGFGIGFIFKILESFFQAVYGKVLILVFIIMFLQFKPKGLFPDKGRIGDD